MKLKCQPDDFQVEELTAFSLNGGPFAVYQLTKSGLGTLEAIEAVCRRWQLPRDRLSWGGLKDRHAVTRQYLTVYQGPRRDLGQESLSLVYQGQADRPFTPADIDGNRFRIAIRDLTPAAQAKVQQDFSTLLQQGTPNYFDDQRFGSLGVSGEFIAQPWCRGDYERTLWLALAEPNVHDRPDDKHNKLILQKHWGDWPTCQNQMSRSSARSIVTYLVDHPVKFREAFARMKVDLRSLYLAAFQSHLWNAMLATALREAAPETAWTELEMAHTKLPFYRTLAEPHLTHWREQSLPLPSARLHLDDSPLLSLYERVLSGFGLTLRELRVKYPRDSFFSKGERQALIVPRRGELHPHADELYPGKQALTLLMDLPRGAYATVVIKRLVEVA